ncbi:MAG: Hdr-like menaquinol oxidoreductase integral membrane subunit HmeB [Gammaproteobacteria bacterium]|nr:MAG: Hdr-like menaquinol oxidoreductase integral membrane subunit HmeB [Gammaproteobacteria bacterium]
MSKIQYDTIEGRSTGFLMLLGIFGAMVLAALGASYFMEHNGHYVTGMSNQIVWGTPHVFAVFLIVAASGALNVSSIGTVFGKAMYKPLSRLSNVLSLTLLTGGLMVLVLDLGRPDRIIIAMTYYNFKSIFAWNMILYNGFFVIVGIYLWTLMDHNVKGYARTAGMAAFIWRLTLTTGTGSIFGFLVAREAYDAAIMAPMFIIMSFSFGLAFYLLVLMAAYTWTGRPLGDAVVTRLKNLLGVFVASVLYFVLVYHLTNLYVTEHHGVERFILLDGGIYTQLFWIGQVIIGGIVPLLIFFTPAFGKSRAVLSLGAVLVILGGLAQMYVIIIGGQAYPLSMFPGMEVSSSFYDGVVANYTPTLAEVLLGLGGIGLALAATTFALKVLPLLPHSLADKIADPHYKAESA